MPSVQSAWPRSASVSSSCPAAIAAVSLAARATVALSAKRPAIMRCWASDAWARARMRLGWSGMMPRARSMDAERTVELAAGPLEAAQVRVHLAEDETRGSVAHAPLAAGLPDRPDSRWPAAGAPRRGGSGPPMPRRLRRRPAVRRAPRASWPPGRAAPGPPRSAPGPSPPGPAGAAAVAARMLRVAGLRGRARRATSARPRWPAMPGPAAPARRGPRGARASAPAPRRPRPGAHAR